MSIFDPTIVAALVLGWGPFPAYPFWSLVIIAVDVVALWGLCTYGSRENLGVA